MPQPLPFHPRAPRLIGLTSLIMDLWNTMLSLRPIIPTSVPSNGLSPFTVKFSNAVGVSLAQEKKSHAAMLKFAVFTQGYMTMLFTSKGLSGN